MQQAIYTVSASGKRMRELFKKGRENPIFSHPAYFLWTCSLLIALANGTVAIAAAVSYLC